MPQAARVGDQTAHGSTLAPGPGCDSVNIGFQPAWRAMPSAMAGAIEAISNAMQSFVNRPAMTPVDATASLAQISAALSQGAAAAASNGSAGSAAAATTAVSTLNATNVTLTTAWTTASAVPGGQPAANTAYTEGIKQAAATAAASVLSSMAGLADMHVCTTPLPALHGPGFVTRGSRTVNIGNLAAARQGDQVYEAAGGPDPIARGCPTVNIGDMGPTGGGTGTGGAGTGGSGSAGSGTGPGGGTGVGPGTGGAGGTGTGAARRSYATAEEAAIAAMREANPRSVAEDREYGGWVHRNPDGTYGYDPPTRGEQHGMPNMPNRGADDVAWYHTHGAESEGYDDDSFSGATGDRGYSRANNATGYLATPSGTIRRYDPSADPTNTPGQGETTLPQTAPP